ncbi:MAG: ABC transporter ATP-binding protein [Leptolyngbyaceae cyanobacterium SM2_5_2]|nr:ABC transporter ATP-binding protein [Leptolyngbyaceae cyanobacterium SM2_5_2]
MSDTVIQVENLGKKYVIGHQQEGHSRYVALRDVLTDGVKSLGHRLRHPRKPRPNPYREEFWALKDVSFEVKQGEVVGIIGRNGAGKSTLLKILSRITEPTTGRVRLRGRVASLLEVGTGFHPELTGRENIFLNGAILGMSRTEINRKFDEIVEFAEVSRFLDTPVKRYSSGMYVRLAFAVAAHLEPEILVVDEVLAVGDAAFQKKCLGRMEAVSKEGRTVLFVSHNMAAINNLCRMGILLANGKVISNAKVAIVIDKYIQLQEGTSSYIQWAPEERPGNSRVELLSAKIISDGQCQDQVDISKELNVEITFKNLKEGAFLYSSIHVKDRYGNCILASVNFPSGTLERDNFACQRLSKGIFTSRCTFPPNFFNDIAYSISVLMLRDDMSVEVICEDLLKFVVVDTGDMRKEFSGYWIGSIRPKLLWQTTAL